MDAQAHQNQTSTENFTNNSFTQASTQKSFQVLSGDNTQFKIENRSRPAWLKESSNVRPTGESFAIYKNRAFQILQSKAQR